MLLRFGVHNDLSFSCRQELSLVPTSLKDREDVFIETTAGKNDHILPAAVVYGANASGKSNLINALWSMREAIVKSHRHGDPEGGVPRQPFALNDENKKLPTVYDADFIVDGIRYHYGFEATDDEFTGEWLYSFPHQTRRLLFEREGAQKIHFGPSFAGPKKTIERLMRNNSLFLSAATQNDHEQLSLISAYFNNMRVNKAISVAGQAVASRFSEDDFDDRTIDFLQRIGTGVIGYRKKEREKSENMKSFEEGLVALFKEQFGDGSFGGAEKLFTEKDIFIELGHKGENDQTVYFELERESAGTRRLLMMLTTAFRALDRGSVFIIDELDASLHTQACEAFVALFAGPNINKNGAQLIATTHDTNLLSSPLLRRDQVWFTEKDGYGSTNLYPLSDIRTRQTDNFEKGYLQGRYGAIPFGGPVEKLFSGRNLDGQIQEKDKAD